MLLLPKREEESPLIRNEKCQDGHNWAYEEGDFGERLVCIKCGLRP
jgi:hypothetical protein